MCKDNKEIQLELDYQLHIIEPKPCKTKIKLKEVMLAHKQFKDTIKAMESFMEETGTLEAWNDNKHLYL